MALDINNENYIIWGLGYDLVSTSLVQSERTGVVILNTHVKSWVCWHTSKPSAGEVERGGSLGFAGQPV